MIFMAKAMRNFPLNRTDPGIISQDDQQNYVDLGIATENGPSKMTSKTTHSVKTNIQSWVALNIEFLATGSCYLKGKEKGGS
jgi:hypothetical protein